MRRGSGGGDDQASESTSENVERSSGERGWTASSSKLWPALPQPIRIAPEDPNQEVRDQEQQGQQQGDDLTNGFVDTGGEEEEERDLQDGLNDHFILAVLVGKDHFLARLLRRLFCGWGGEVLHVVKIAGLGASLASVLGGPGYLSLGALPVVLIACLELLMLDLRVVIQLTMGFEFYFVIVNFFVMVFSMHYMFLGPTCHGTLFSYSLSLALLPGIFADALVIRTGLAVLALFEGTAIVALLGICTWYEMWTSARYRVPLFLGFSSTRACTLNRAAMLSFFAFKNLYCALFDGANFAVLRRRVHRVDIHRIAALLLERSAHRRLLRRLSTSTSGLKPWHTFSPRASVPPAASKAGGGSHEAAQWRPLPAPTAPPSPSQRPSPRPSPRGAGVLADTEALPDLSSSSSSLIPSSSSSSSSSSTHELWASSTQHLPSSNSSVDGCKGVVAGGGAHRPALNKQSTTGSSWIEPSMAHEAPPDFCLLGVLLGPRRARLRDRMIEVGSSKRLMLLLGYVEVVAYLCSFLALTGLIPLYVGGCVATLAWPNIIYRALVLDTRALVALMWTPEFVFVMVNYAGLCYAFFVMLPGWERVLIGISLTCNQVPALFLDAETLMPQRAMEESMGALAAMTIYVTLVWERVYVKTDYEHPIFWGLTHASSMYIDRGFIMWVYFMKYTVALAEAKHALVILKRPIPRSEINTFPTTFSEAYRLRLLRRSSANKQVDHAEEGGSSTMATTVDDDAGSLPPLMIQINGPVGGEGASLT